MNQSTRSTRFFVLSVCIGLIISFLGAIGTYIWKFGTDLSREHTRWGEFGSYVSGVLGFALTTGTLVIAVYATVYLPQQLEKQRATAELKLDEQKKAADKKLENQKAAAELKLEEQKKAAERTRATVEISRILYDRSFYININAPAWEIAVKWLYWEGPEGNEYRYKVCGGMFLYDTYSNFHTAEEANAHPHQNLIRFGSHFLPYDHMKENDVAKSMYIGIIDQLSEHQVLAIWVQFWCNLDVLLEEELVDRSLVRKLFKDWYSSWLQFMLQLRSVGDILAKTRNIDGRSSLGGDPQFECFSQIEAIEKVLYESSQEYKDHDKDAKTRADEIAIKTLELHNAATQRPRSNIDKHNVSFPAAGNNLVLLEPDITEAFPTAASVNQALRSLLPIANKQQPNHKVGAN